MRHGDKCVPANTSLYANLTVMRMGRVRWGGGGVGGWERGMGGMEVCLGEGICWRVYGKDVGW